MSAGAVVKEAFSAYRAWGLYLVGLAAAFYALLAVVALVLAVPFGVYAAGLLLAFGGPWAVALIVDAVAAIEEPTADRSLTGRLHAILPYLGTLTAVWLGYNVLVSVGFMLFVVPGLVFMTWWALVVPVVVLERTGVRRAFSRSKRLVTGKGLTVFWTLILAGVLSAVPAFLVSGPALSLPVSPLTATVLAGAAAGTVTAPFVALCLVVLYSDLRSRFAAPIADSWMQPYAPSGDA
ncbi:MAG TPA: hypothetical protein VD769_07200 [Gaiellaceae bacterium]|nr:hypothetical protein [Gaiellaceae bacterium]